MKPIVDIIFGSIKWVITAVVSIISGWIWFNSYFEAKVEASETRIMENVKVMRDADMQVMNAIKQDTNLIKQHLLGRNK